MRLMPRSIRTRVIYTMLLVLLVTGIGFVVLINSIVRASFEEMEVESMRRDSLRVQEALDSNVAWLRSVSGDWARWTDTYEYLDGTNPTYVEDNLSPESMQVLGADFMAYLDADGKIYHVSAVDRETGQPIVASPSFKRAIETLSSRVYRLSDGARAKSGQVLLPSGPATIVLQGITTSNGEKPPNGVLVTGAYIDSSTVQNLRRLTQLNVTVASPKDRLTVLRGHEGGPPERLGQVYVEEHGQSSLESWATVRGLDGEPALLYIVTEPRSAMQRAGETLHYVGLGLLGIVTLSGIAIAMTLEFSVMRRLTRLHQEVSEISTMASADRKVTADGDDEIADIAVALNTNLDSLTEAEDALKHAADHDYLTGLANRRRFELDVERALAESERTGAPIAWVLIDLDDFKEVNDTMGHHCGDSVLVWFAEMMRTSIRRYSTIARLGGDEFAILLPHSDEYDAAVVADRLLTALSDAECDACEGHAFRVDASVGIAVAPRDGHDVNDLSRAADEAMYHAKLSRAEDKAHRLAREAATLTDV